MVAQDLVELIASLHPVREAALGAVLADRAIDVRGGLAHGPERRQGVEHQPDPGLPELVHAEQRRLAELGQVGQHRHVDAAAKSAVVLQRIHRFGEDHVRPRLHVAPHPFQRGVQSLAGEGVGAGHDDELVVGASVRRRLDAVRHLVGGDDLLVGPVAAALGLHLVLHVDRGRSARIISRMVREMLKAVPQPVSMSTSSGSGLAAVIRRTSSSTSFRVVMPRSGWAKEALATPAPDR